MFCPMFTYLGLISDCQQLPIKMLMDFSAIGMCEIHIAIDKLIKTATATNRNTEWPIVIEDLNWIMARRCGAAG